MAGMLHIRRLSQYLLTPVVIILILAMVIGLFFIGIPGLQAKSASNQYLYKGTAASVNGEKINADDFNKFYLQLLQNYGAYFPEDQIKDSALKTAIDEKLILQAIKERKIKVSRSELETAMKELKKAYPTEEQMESLFAQVGVANMKGLEKVMEKQLQWKALYAQLAEEDKIEVTEEEIREKYEQIDAAHIMIATNEQLVENPPSDSEALKEAQLVYEKLQNGADFVELAKEYSDDRSNKDNGGQIGLNLVASYRKGLGDSFTDAALALQVGEVSNPVKTSAGYHIIKVLDKKMATGEEWEKQKPALRKEILAEKFVTSDKINTWLQKQADEAEVVILDPALRAFRLRTENKFTEAVQAYEKALTDKRYKNNLDIYIATAQTYREAEKYDEALEVLARIPKKITDELSVLFTKAQIYQSKGDEETTKQTLSTLVEKCGENVNNLKQVLYLMNQFEYKEEAEALEAKIKQIETERAEEQKAFQELLRQEQEKIEAENKSAETE